MPRPDFPRPYTPLTPATIRRINEEQAHYDRDPERAEREQRAAEERREEDRRMEEEYYRQQYEEGEG